MLGGIDSTQITDLSKMITKVFDEINQKTIDAGKKSQDYDSNSVEAQEFAKDLENAFQKQELEQQAMSNSSSFLDQLGIPAGLNIEGIGDTLKNDIIPEVAGTLASSNAGTSLKNQASNFIQKLINSYRDKGSIIGFNV